MLQSCPEHQQRGRSGRFILLEKEPWRFLASPARLGRCGFFFFKSCKKCEMDMLFSGAASKPNVRLGLFEEGLKSLARVPELASNNRGSCSASLPEEPCEYKP